MGIIDALYGKKGERQPAPERYIRETNDNRLLYKKAYLIEFYGNDTNIPDDVFTFSIPPESEELKYSQLKTETETFGGLHVDEYGTKAAKINISGSTINQTLKMIHRPGKDDKWLSGEEEIYYFRDLILKYRSLEQLQKEANGKIVIYDLSKFSTSKYSSTKGINFIENYWRAIPGDFTIRRSNDRPFTYKYSFEFTGIPLAEGREFASHGGPPDPIVGKLGLIQKLMNDLISVIDFVDGINAKVNNVLDDVNKISSLLKTLGNVLTYSTKTLTGIMNSVSNTAVGFIDGATRIVDGVNSVISLPRAIRVNALNIGIEMQNATNRLVKSTATLVENCRDTFDPGGDYHNIPQEVLDKFSMNNEEFKDSVNTMLDRAENTANELAVYAKSTEIPEVTEGNPDPITGESRIVLSYGHTSVTLKDNDSLESLATQYLGSPDRAIDIATFNSVASLSDLRPGDIIRIPITVRTNKITNNLIFSRREDRDNYGRDALLTDNGYIVASNTGDYELTSGVNNLSQAVLLRLRERVAKRIRLNIYGIRTYLSDAAGVAYIVSSIELTVGNDPRVAAVDDIRFRARGDVLEVVVFYHDINNSKGRASGGI
ncbi:MAG: hypothetical protein LBQ89_08270 [Treponema sp.]|jgi:hypothetical protein|nr:hypothetical protein [Treponema sp.]